MIGGLDKPVTGELVVAGYDLIKTKGGSCKSPKISC
jgi:hypothetical protein